MLAAIMNRNRNGSNSHITNTNTNITNNSTSKKYSTLGTSTTSATYSTMFSRGLNNGNNSSSKDKNLFGSSQDLMNHTLQIRNHNLTANLVKSKQEWEALQKQFRSVTHTKFVYQTTLARIVSHVQDFADPSDEESHRLLQDLHTWVQDCEHISSSPTLARLLWHSKDSDESTRTATSSSSQGSNNNKENVTIEDDDDKNEKEQPKSSSSSPHRTPIIDYSDVQPFVDTSTIPIIPRSHHESLQEQNDVLEREIHKWQASMVRIRKCHEQETSELESHQTTLENVVKRIQQSSFDHQDNVTKWYNECIRHAEKCRQLGGSFSCSSSSIVEVTTTATPPSTPNVLPKATIKTITQDVIVSSTQTLLFCRRCHSKLSTDEADSDQECIENDEPKPKNEEKQECGNETIFMNVTANTKVTERERPDTPTSSTIATSSMVEEPSPIPSVPNISEVKMTSVAPPTTLMEHHPSMADIAAANVDDPPDRIQPTATNLQGSSIVQDQPISYSKCLGDNCILM